MAGSQSDTLTALQNGVQAINNLADAMTTAFSSIPQATTPGGSSGQVQFNNSGSFGGFTLGGDATLISSAGTLTITSHAVTYGKIQAESSGTLLGNLGTGSTSPSEQVSSAVAAWLAPFSSVQQGVVVPSSNSNSSGFYLGGDSAFHPLPPVGMTYLGTVATVSSRIVDTSSTSSILASNASLYRQFKLVFNNIIPTANNSELLLQVHTSTGGFQTSSYVSGSDRIGNAGGVSYQAGTSGVQIWDVSLTNSAPGFNGDLLVRTLSGTSALKVWHGTGSAFVTPSVLNAKYGGYWNASSVGIDGFQLATSSNVASGSVDIYGLL